MTGPLIIGVGNPFRGDDAVGPQVVEALKAHIPAHQLRLCRGDAAELMELWAGRGRVIVVDAVRGVGKAGAIIQRELRAEGLPEGMAATSTHAFGLAEAVELSRALGQLPERLELFGVEAATMEHGASMSPPVAEAAGAVVAMIIEARRADVSGDPRAG